MYNVHVDGLHNYHVGEGSDSLLVHNDCYETFYRTMSPEDFAHLQVHGHIRATAETFISTRLEYAAAYDGVTVELMAKKAILAALEKMGVRHRLPGSVEAGTERLNNLVSVDQLKQYGLKWTESGVSMFKSERNTLNIGLGRSGALDTLNDRLLSYKVAR